MFSVARSRLSLPTHFLLAALNGLGVVLAILYNNNTPDLYPNNSHHTLGCVLTIIICAQACMAWVRAYTDTTKVIHHVDERMAFIPISTQAMEEHRRVQALAAGQSYRFSNDSGQGTERNTESLRSQSRSSVCEDSNDHFFNPDLEDDSYQETAEKQGLTETRSLDRFLFKNLPALLPFRTLVILEFVHGSFNRVILILGFMGLTTGIVTYAGIFVRITPVAYIHMIANKAHSEVVKFFRGLPILSKGVFSFGMEF